MALGSLNNSNIGISTMLKKFGYFLLGCTLSVGSLVAQNTPTDAATIYSEIADTGGILDNAIGVFNTVVTVILAVVALGILINFAKRVKSR